MSSLTAKYGIPYPTTPDTIASLAATGQSMAGRMDLLLGESGQMSVTGAANTTINVAISLSRVYPGNTGANVPGIVFITPVSSTSSTNNLAWWISAGAWTGSATTITGFTFSCQLSLAPSGRLINWRYFPVL